eukprot:14244111-Heterocapsa_arctica.AAC.1
MPAPGARELLLEACTDEHSTLGKIGLNVRRPVTRVTMKDDMMDSATMANLIAQGSDQLRARILRMRAETMIMLYNFSRAARVVPLYGGAVSFEWPSHCSRWKQQAVIDMIDELGTEPVRIHGCQVRSRPTRASLS